MRVAFFSALALAGAAACASEASVPEGGPLTAVEQTQAELETAEAEANTASAADACFTTFESCKAAEGADIAACRSALRECLPKAPHPGKHCGHHHGKGRHGKGEDGKGHHGKGHGSKGHDGRGHDGPHDEAGEGPDDDGDNVSPPDADGGVAAPGRAPRFCKSVRLAAKADIQACRETLVSCIKADSAPDTCFKAHRDCVKAAFKSAKDAIKSGADAGT